MLADERRSLILEDLYNNGIVKVNELSEKYDVTVETVRRDISALQAQNLVRKVYGGAVPISSTVKDSLYASRETLHAKGKAAIGRFVAEKIHEGETILLGSGTTTLEIAKNLKHFNNLTVITNSFPVIMELISTKLNIFCLGGHVGNIDMNMIGAFTINALKEFHVDCAFITALGITIGAGVTCYSSEEAFFARQVRDQSGKLILVADSSKFGNNSLVIQGQLTDYDTIITDSNIDKTYLDEFAQNDVKLILAPVK